MNQYLRKNGYKNTGCHSSLHPSSSAWSSDGWRNTASAKDCGILLEKSIEVSVFLNIFQRNAKSLLHQTETIQNSIRLPTGIVCANKTGETSSVQHDMAIVYGKKTNYVLCIFSEGASEDHFICYGIRSISSRVYQYLNK